MCIFFIKDGHKYKLTLLQGEILQFIERRDSTNANTQ